MLPLAEEVEVVVFVLESIYKAIRDSYQREGSTSNTLLPFFKETLEAHEQLLLQHYPSIEVESWMNFFGGEGAATIEGKKSQSNVENDRERRASEADHYNQLRSNLIQEIQQSLNEETQVSFHPSRLPLSSRTSRKLWRVKLTCWRPSTHT